MRVENRHFQEGRYPPRSYYIGRPGRIARAEISRGALDATVLGNPYTLAKHGDQAIPLYRRWLWRKISGRAGEVFACIDGLPEEAYLICSCAPGPCHGDVVIGAWRWVRHP